ncbi:cytidylate kinase-like family protein [Dehalococcoides mccartyi]|nr:cytidylate kinase-like family protein [Dehalococcoides mccartyi]
MSVITIDGQIGAGGPELGKRVARMFDFDYVDRIALPRSLTDGKQIAPVGFTDRFWAIVERAVSGFALGNAAGDPYFNVAEALNLPLTWDTDGPSQEHATSEAKSSVDTLFDEGSVVLVHRAGCVEVGDRTALKVGLFASWEDRVERIMKREGLMSVSDAENTIERREKLQREYFGDVHGAEPDDRNLYDIIVDTSSENIPVASIKVARFARQALALQTA